MVWPPGCEYPDPAVLPLSFVPVDEPKRVKNRVHLDLATTSAAHEQAEVSRLLDLGATLADVGQGAAAWVVLADPEGNQLCGSSHGRSTAGSALGRRRGRLR